MVEWARRFHQLYSPTQLCGRGWDDEINSNELRFLSHSLLSSIYQEVRKEWKEYCKDVLFLGPKVRRSDTWGSHLGFGFAGHLKCSSPWVCRFSSQYDQGESERLSSEWEVRIWSCLIRFSLKEKPYQTEEGCLSLVGSRPTTRYEEISVAIEIWIGKQKQFICQAFRPRSVSMKWII